MSEEELELREDMSESKAGHRRLRSRPDRKGGIANQKKRPKSFIVETPKSIQSRSYPSIKNANNGRNHQNTSPDRAVEEGTRWLGKRWINLIP